MNILPIILLLCTFICRITELNGVDNAHRYRARCFYEEPRLEKYGLKTYNFQFLAGSGPSSPCFKPMPPSKPPLETINLIECTFDGYYNWGNGFFGRFHAPFRALQVVNAPRTTDTIKPDGIPHTTGFGDLSLMAGWTINSEPRKHCDFIDFTLQSGVLLPAAPRRPIGRDRLIARGYGGRIGIPLQCAVSVGKYDWLTLGLWSDFMFFCTPGPKTLGGTIYSVGAFFKGDHVVRDLSVTVNYAYDHQSGAGIIGWHMHTLNLQVEYDFSDEEHPHRPRIGFTYNRMLGGKHLVATSMGGFTVCFDLV